MCDEAIEKAFVKYRGSANLDCRVLLDVLKEAFEAGWNASLKHKKTKKNPMSKEKCKGCRNDFYNGKNDVGVKECWSFKDAKLVKRKRVYMDDVPPWKHKPIEVPSCYHESGYIFVNPDQTC